MLRYFYRITNINFRHSSRKIYFQSIKNVGNYLLGVSIVPTVSTVKPVTLSENYYSDLLKHPCTLTVNAAVSLLTTTMSELDDLSQKYKQIISKIIALHNDCILMNGWDDQLWESIIEARQKLNATKRDVEFLLSYADSVDNVVTAAIEAAFNINADYLCTTLCEQQHSAEVKLAEIKKEIQSLDEQYLKVQRQITEIPAFQNQ